MPEETMSKIISDFIVHLRAAGRAASTIDCYQRDLERLAHILGNIQPKRISDTDIDRAVVKIATPTRNSVRCSSATINRIKSAYRSFFKWAFESKRISSNPSEGLCLSKTHSRPTAPITAAEIMSFLETIRQSDDLHSVRDEALFATYAYTGIRRSEVLSLTLQDYDHGSRVLFLTRTKSGSRQTKIVPSPLVDILIKRSRVLLREHVSLKQAMLFPGKSGDQPMSVRQVQVRFDKWKKLSGIRKMLTIHSFRAGFATSLYETTGDIFLVARAMGHRDVSTTIRYIKANSSLLRRAVEYTFQRPSKVNQLI
jgi:integrase/recombinase XerC